MRNITLVSSEEQIFDLALTLDMSGVVLPTPGQLVVVSRLEDDVLGLILGRERLPRLLFLPGVGGPGLV